LVANAQTSMGKRFNDVQRNNVKYFYFSKFLNKSTWGDVCVMSMLLEVCVFPILHVRLMDVFVYVSLCQFLHVLMF
jgi:hypothetical protein